MFLPQQQMQQRQPMFFGQDPSQGQIAQAMPQAPQPQQPSALIEALRARQMADAVAGTTNNIKAQDPFGAVAQGIAGGLEGWTASRAQEKELANQQAADKEITDALSSDDPLKALSRSQSPEGRAAYRQLRLADLSKKPAEQWQDVDTDGDGSPDAQRNSATQEYKPISKELTFEQRRQIAGAGAPRTDIHMPKQVTKFEEKFGEQLATDYSDIQKSGRASIEQQAKVQRLGSLLDKTYTGKGGETVQDLKSLASSLGFKVEGVAEGDAARAISNELALQIRNPDLGPGMPGALSERDITFLVSINPGLGLTPGGNKMLVDYWTRINKRKQEMANLARSYRAANNGVFDEGFNQVAAQFAQQNPLFSEKDMHDYQGAMARQPANSPVTGKTLNWTPGKGIH